MSSLIPFFLAPLSKESKEREKEERKYTQDKVERVLCFPFLDTQLDQVLLFLKKMVRIGGILVCMLVVAMDVAAGFLGIQAEIAQNKVKHLRLWIFECREPSEDAFKLGLAAAGILVLAHVIANLLGGCACICSQEDLQRASPHRQLSVACFLFSWIILAAGLSMLGIGTLSNNKSRTSCGFTHHHFFSFGGILCFVHGLFCVAYYVSVTAAVSEEKHGGHA